jgi:hypothetical protein
MLMVGGQWDYNQRCGYGGPCTWNNLRLIIGVIDGGIFFFFFFFFFFFVFFFFFIFIFIFIVATTIVAIPIRRCDFHHSRSLRRTMDLARGHALEQLLLLRMLGRGG